MAYSDYGGYAYRDGTLIIDRSDFTIAPPGVFIADAPLGHAVVGDGPIYVSLYKQSSVSAYLVQDDKITEISLVDYAPASSIQEYNGKKYLDISNSNEICFINHDLFYLSMISVETDNYYCLVKFEQPSTPTWHAFSGYGVGAGLESGSHGYDTNSCIDLLEETFDVSLERRAD